MAAVPGSLWAKRGRWYWRLASRHVPPSLRWAGRYTSLPVVLRGQRLATASKGRAEARRRELWRQWSRRAARADAGDPAAPPARSAGRLLDEYEQWCALRSSALQARRNRRIAQALADSLGAASLEDLAASHIQTHLARLAGRSARTVQAHRNSLHLFCRWLLIVGRLDRNPVDQVPVKAPARQAPRYLDDRQLAALLARVDAGGPAWIRQAVRVALFAGCRLSSLRALCRRHVGKGGLSIPLPKTGSTTVVPYDHPAINKRLAQVAAALRDPKAPPAAPLFPAHNSAWWCKALAALTAGLAVFGEAGRAAGSQWHLLRATWAVNCARRGATLWELMELGGWTGPQVVMRYVNVARAAGLERPGGPLTRKARGGPPRTRGPGGRARR